MITGLLSGLLVAALLTLKANWTTQSVVGKCWATISLWTILAVLGTLIGGAVS